MIKLNPVGGNTIVILPTVSSAQDTLSSASAPGYSSKSFYPLTYRKRAFTFIAQQQPAAYATYISSVSTYPGMTESSFHPASPAEHFEARTVCCAPPHCRRAAKPLQRNCRSSAGTKPSCTGTRCC